MVSDIKNGQTVRMESLDHYIYVMIMSFLSLSFHSRLVHHFVVIGLEKMKFVLKFMMKL